ncbi:MAG: TIGR02266 family protein [bacterium]
MSGDKSKNKRVKEVMFEEKKRSSDEVLFYPNNQRVSERIEVELEVTLSGPHTFFSGLTMDISEGGVFVATHQIFPIGTEFRVILVVGKNKLEINSEVVWVRNEYSAKISGENPGMGLKFIKLDKQSHLIISEFIKRKEPILYDDCL